MNDDVRTAAKALELVKPFPFLPITELMSEGVKSYVNAQKALMEVMAKPATEHKHTKAEHRARRTPRAKKAKAAAAVA